ncbi:hypothetical protein BRARA_H01117 [Brassica rapa]|uniref:Uncharacterized protein n=1 Tax=Brassica campestris TaxID=3711 RepID=A0A397YEW3_BRACM|nr:hypothetical protein BRARA_H01117 [Brassica rapa]
MCCFLWCYYVCCKNRGTQSRMVHLEQYPPLENVFYYEFTWFFPLDQTRTHPVSILMTIFRSVPYVSDFLWL